MVTAIRLNLVAGVTSALAAAAALTGCRSAGRRVLATDFTPSAASQQYRLAQGKVADEGGPGYVYLGGGARDFKFLTVSADHDKASMHADVSE